MTNTSKVLLAFLVGGTVGAAAALLLAPSSGADTRKRIKDSVDEAKLLVEEKTVGLKRAFSEKKEGLRAAYDATKDAFVKAAERVTQEG